MSRSYRRPWCTDGYKGSKRRQYCKNYANRVIRRLDEDEEIPNGKAYRKYYDSWDICDYRWHWDSKPYIRMWNGVQELIEPSPFWRVCRK